MSEAARNFADAPIRAVRLGPQDVDVERRADGTMILRSREPLGPYPGKLTERLDHWAKATPDRVFMAERDASGGWRTVTYAQARAEARAIGAAL